jgi:uncharacterized protein
VVGCVPGAELTEVVDSTTFKGKVKVKVGPITVAYSGTARISDRDEASRTARLTADGRETTGPGSAQASATMKVQAAGDGSLVEIVTEYQVRGRVANFGRGVMEDVSKRLIKDMASCIQANLEAGDPPVGANAPAVVERSTPAMASAPRAAATAAPVNAFSLLWHLIKLRVGRLFGRS